MLLDQDTKTISDIDLALIDRVREKCSQVDWMHSKFHRFEETLTEGRLCTLPYVIRTKDQKIYTPEQEDLINLAMPIVDEVKKHFPDLTPIRGEIVNLLPGKQLGLHVDIYWFHKHSKRIHVPIQTNDDCFQIFEDREEHLSVGKIYEINNRIMHSARNSGTEPRIHIIIDLMDQEH
jgi:hypothetical protein